MGKFGFFWLDSLTIIMLLFSRCHGGLLAVGLKALNDRIRHLYETLDIPCGVPNRFCIGEGAPPRGGRPRDPEHVLGEGFRQLGAESI